MVQRIERTWWRRRAPPRQIDCLAAADRGTRASWPAVMDDLNSLTETEVEQDGKRFLPRSSPRPGASLPRALGPRHRPAAYDAPGRGRLIYADLLFCNATPAAQRDFACAIKNLVPGTVEDRSGGAFGENSTGIDTQSVKRVRSAGRAKGSSRASCTRLRHVG